MKLHEAIIKLLKQSGRPMTTHEIADKLNENKWYRKKDRSRITADQIRGRTNQSGNYSHLFNRDGALVILVGQSEIPDEISSSQKPTSKNRNKTLKNKKKNEDYVIDLCDKILGSTSSRQHKFEFLIGDPDKNGKCRKLPVDAYYEKLNLVVEYREKQHSERVPFFDKPDKMTVSGVSRDQQRKIYDERRRKILPKHNIKLVEISYSDFEYYTRKHIIRNTNDEAIVRHKLKDF